jgi:hypothetical protein
MFKKMLLAGAVIVGGALCTADNADAQFGPVVRFGGPAFGGPVMRGPVYGGPMVRTVNPYMMPRYGAGYRYGFQPNYRVGYPGYRFNTPAYRSFRGPMGPVYGPGFYGPGFGRPSGFSVNVGPVFRGW